MRSDDRPQYGSEGWTLDEIFNTEFRVSFDETAGVVELKRVGAELARVHHRASFEAARSTELLAMAEKAYENASVTISEAIREDEEKKDKKDRLTEKQRTNLTASKVEPFAAEHRSRKYEVSLWNRILETLKFAAKRVDSSIIIESVEAKMIKSQDLGRMIDSQPFKGD
jgi:Arc/MetJ-type ribon-helix-helix transcriptional regulator